MEDYVSDAMAPNRFRTEAAVVEGAGSGGVDEVVFPL